MFFFERKISQHENALFKKPKMYIIFLQQKYLCGQNKRFLTAAKLQILPAFIDQNGSMKLKGECKKFSKA